MRLEVLPIESCGRNLTGSFGLVLGSIAIVQQVHHVLSAGHALPFLFLI